MAGFGLPWFFLCLGFGLQPRLGLWRPFASPRPPPRELSRVFFLLLLLSFGHFQFSLEVLHLVSFHKSRANQLSLFKRLGGVHVQSRQNVAVWRLSLNLSFLLTFVFLRFPFLFPLGFACCLTFGLCGLFCFSILDPWVLAEPWIFLLLLLGLWLNLLRLPLGWPRRGSRGRIGWDGWGWRACRHTIVHPVNRQWPSHTVAVKVVILIHHRIHLLSRFL
mmetsp:Transcript_67571/g.148154  ORF Transcript_67571/g.148154 Transcript_67571/m.148154 type:complete len:219 (-) Transcript_67571:1522-2178(-)